MARSVTDRGGHLRIIRLDGVDSRAKKFRDIA